MRWLLILALASCGGLGPGDENVDAAAATLQGVDISHFNGPIDWSAVKRSGRAFAVAAIGDGLYQDPTFAGHWSAIRAAGMARGAYQFFRAAVDPVAQANIAVAAVGRLGPGDLPVTLDVEGASMQGVPPATIAARIAAWMDVVERGTGKPPVIYTGVYAWNDSVQSGAFGAHPLWIASYGVPAPALPRGWSRWTFWQTTSSGSVPGIQGRVDLDLFNGTQADLDKLTGARAPGRDVAVRPDGSGYLLDGWGGIRPFGGAPAVSDAASWPGFDIARRIVLRADGRSGYVLDGWGGMHPFGGAPAVAGYPYWQGWDIARAVALRADGKSGYVVDGYGGVHAFGGAPAVSGFAYWPGWDIARDIALRADGVSGYVLDGWGGIHPFGGAPEAAGYPYWKGWDLARGIALRPDGTSGYVLDGWGGIHPFGGAPAATGYGYWPGRDVARGIKLNGARGAVAQLDGNAYRFTTATR
jgi:GH25 family lysozyme M1 (1,4-beta-N-acetylmuramidase)